jgi:predicted DCC family thiol-disulfide oxidoreductase YuxK
VSDGIVLFDAVCNLCCGSVQFVIRRDPQLNLHFCSLQSARGKSLLAEHGLSAEDMSSMVLIVDDSAYLKSTAALKTAAYMRKPWSFLVLLLIMPEGLRDWVYNRVAKHRYAWFGKKESCWLGNMDIEQRFIH